MRLIWWLPEGTDPDDYLKQAVKDRAEIQLGVSEFIEPHLKGDYKTARIIEIPTVMRRFRASAAGLRLGDQIMFTYDDEADPEANVDFMIEQQDIGSRNWKQKEVLPAQRINKWTQAKSVAYDDMGYYRASVWLKGKPMEGVRTIDFFYYE